MVQLVWRHSCVADRVPVVDRIPAGPWVSLKTLDPPKRNGLGQKKKKGGCVAGQSTLVADLHRRKLGVQ